MSSRLERDIQLEVTNFAEDIRLLPIRLNVVGRKGWPDYAYGYRGHLCFVEFKRPGEKPEPLQKHVHDRLRSYEFDVFVVDNSDYGETLLKEWKLYVDSKLDGVR